MFVTLFGIGIDANLEQPANASTPMFVTPSGMVKPVKQEQP